MFYKWKKFIILPFFLIFIFKVQFDIAMNRLTEEITKMKYAV